MRAARSPLARLALFAGAALTVFAALWVGGLLWFVHRLPEAVADPSSETDAIVVLTGGSLRVRSGLTLLAERKARKLFVSGVHAGTDVSALLRTSRQSPEWIACCIVLGYEADNTRGNAQETAQWMREEGFRSLRLVTSSYHMPRSLVEFSRAMPGITIIANPVVAESIRQKRWWAWPGTLSLIVSEYDKYLAAWARAAIEDKIGPRAALP